MPWLRNRWRYSLSDFSSTHDSAGVYVNVRTPKSGWPVFGHTLVNSGQTISMVNSRPGRGFGNVSGCSADGVSFGAMCLFRVCRCYLLLIGEVRTRFNTV